MPDDIYSPEASDGGPGWPDTDRVRAVADRWCSPPCMVASMNLDQIQSLIRTLLAAGGPLAALLVQYGMPADKVSIWLSLALAILPPAAAGIWGIVTKTDRAKVAAAGAMDGVTVTVGPDASLGARQAAADPQTPGVTVANTP